MGIENRTQISIAEDATKRLLRLHAALRKEAQDCKPDDNVSVVIAAGLAILEEIIAVRDRGYTQIFASNPETGGYVTVDVHLLLKDPETKDQDHDDQDHA